MDSARGDVLLDELFAVLRQYHPLHPLARLVGLSRNFVEDLVQ
jgi:hypothetical protein